MSAPSPVSSGTGLVSFSIKVNGVEIDTAIQVVSIAILSKVYNTLFTSASAFVTIIDGDPSIGSFSICDSAVFSLSNKIEIAAGYNGINNTIFTGEIMSKRIQADSYEGSKLILECTGDEIPLPDNTQTSPALTITYGESILDMDLLLYSTHGDVYGNITFQGSSLAAPGAAIQLEGCSIHFNGVHIISQVDHTIESGNWHTEATVGTPPESD